MEVRSEVLVYIKIFLSQSKCTKIGVVVNSTFNLSKTCRHLFEQLNLTPLTGAVVNYYTISEKHLMNRQ